MITGTDKYPHDNKEKISSYHTVLLKRLQEIKEHHKSTLILKNYLFSSTFIIRTGTSATYYSVYQGNVTGGNYDSTARTLTIMDNAQHAGGPIGFNPSGYALRLDIKYVQGSFVGPNYAGHPVQLFYQG